MGKDKVKKRITIQKQFVTYYILVLTFSLVATFIAIVSFYTFYHHLTGHDSGHGSIEISNPRVREIVEFAEKHGSSISDQKHKGDLDKLVRKGDMEYYIKDMNDKMLFSSTRQHRKNHSSFAWDVWTSILDNSLGTSSVSIPLINKNSGRIDREFILLQYDHMWFVLLVFVDIGIPFVCFILFTLLFSGKISHKIRIPLNELMFAVEKIKKKDLDFNVECCENNEIGDLAAAFEGMRGELKNSLIREWQLEQDRREMVSAITHDIKTPLAIIQGHVEGLQDGLKNDGAKLDSYLNTIEQNVMRAKKLVDEMNGLVEVDSADFSLARLETDLPGFVNKKISELRILAGKRKIRVEADVSDLRVSKNKVPVDSDRLEQIIDNLIGNSIRFTPENGKISLNIRIAENKAVFKFCDTGPGFIEKDLKNLFRKFYKGDSSRSREKGHSGLGLYIAKTLVVMHGGEIKASNLDSGGACVEFWISF